MRSRLLRALGASACSISFAALGGCGDVSVVRLDVNFVDDALEVQTGALRVVTRTVPVNPDLACQNFSTLEPPPNLGVQLASGESIFPWPVDDPTHGVLIGSEADGSPSGIDLTRYDALTFIVLAYPSTAVEQSEPIAGFCENVQIDTDGRISVPVILEAL